MKTHLITLNNKLNKERIILGYEAHLINFKE